MERAKKNLQLIEPDTDVSNQESGDTPTAALDSQKLLSSEKYDRLPAIRRHSQIEDQDTEKSVAKTQLINKLNFINFQDETVLNLASKGIHANNNFKYPVYDLPIAKDYKDKKGYPHAEKVAQRCLLLPLYDFMTEAEQKHIIDSLLMWDGDK